jgi:LAO/AO transport system kinase
MNISPDLAINPQRLLQSIRQGNKRILARAISLIENEVPGYEQLLQALPNSEGAGIIGITGPPGAGKSSLVDLLVGQFIPKGKKVAVICVDPSSIFHHGALLGDRIRMSTWYDHADVFIRSLATHGSLGGLHPKIIEITDLLKVALFDYIIVETVGVGQSEIEIAGVADITIVVLVPEAGDEIQVMKAGLSEIADIFVVNKSDRPGADLFAKNLLGMMAPELRRNNRQIPVLKTIASERKGVAELAESIVEQLASLRLEKRKMLMMTEKVYQLIAHHRMKDISKSELEEKIREELGKKNFNLYRFVAEF